jgi:hypothetical protein
LDGFVDTENREGGLASDEASEDRGGAGAGAGEGEGKTEGWLKARQELE